MNIELCQLRLFHQKNGSQAMYWFIYHVFVNVCIRFLVAYLCFACLYIFSIEILHKTNDTGNNLDSDNSAYYRHKECFYFI